MLSEEEIIKVLKNHAQYTNAKVIDANTRKEYKVSEAIDGLLDLYNKQNKIIDKMIDEIYDLGQKQDMRNEHITIWIDKEHILNYFTKLVEEKSK